MRENECVRECVCVCPGAAGCARLASSSRRAFAVKVEGKRLPVSPFSRLLKGCKGHKTHRSENGGTNQIRETWKRGNVETYLVCEGVCERARERERERERKTEKETDRTRDRQRDREREKESVDVSVLDLRLLLVSARRRECV